MPRLVLALALFSCVSSASAQIIYDPVEYQYNAGGTTYYYGGSDPRVHDYARELYSPGGSWGRGHGFSFYSGDTRSSREVTSEPDRIFTDSFHGGLLNARLLGFTPNNARDEAYANAPRYFAKRDLLASAVRVNGAWHVPPQAPTVFVYKSSGMRIDDMPTTMPRPLMIIPKDSLKLPKGSDKLMASAK